MSKDINQVILVGNLVKDPEFKTNDKGRTQAKLLIATGKFVIKHHSDQISDFDWDDGESFSKDTMIHEVRIHVEHICHLCESLEKGDRVIVGGELRHGNNKSYIILLAPEARFYKVE